MIAPLMLAATDGTTADEKGRGRGALAVGAAFVAKPDERLTRSLGPLSKAGTRNALALVCAFLLHAVVLALLIFERQMGPAIAPTAVEIPVEIVVEPPPKPEPPPAQPQPPTPTLPIDEQPATDAPRAATQEKTDRDASEKETKAPGAPTQATAPSLSPTPAKETAATPLGAPKPAQSAAEPLPENPAGEATQAPIPDHDAAKDETQAVDPNAQPNKLPSFVGQPFPKWSTGATFATADALPDIELGGAAEAAPVAGGKARTTYLSILYGLVMSHMRKPADARESSARGVGAITFVIDGTGHLVQRQIAVASGSRELDAAALEAVTEAAPFPAPPQGLPARLRFTYGNR